MMSVGDKEVGICGACVCVGVKMILIACWCVLGMLDLGGRLKLIRFVFRAVNMRVYMV